MKHLIYIVAIVVGMSTAGAVTLDEVASMIRTGELDNVSAALDSIAAKAPKNAEVDFVRGQYYLALNNDRQAAEAFQSAHRKGSNDALLQLAEIACRELRADDAEAHVDAYRAYIAKNRKKKLTDNSGDIDSRITRVRNMLDRVEDIVVIDSMLVDADDFFTHYRLSRESGRLSSSDELQQTFGAADGTVVYTTEDSRRMIWVKEDDNNNLQLMSSDALVGGEWDEPVALGEQLSLGADANYPFLMPDGVTLYFASNGDDSLGGYDIFMSRDNGNGFLAPFNVGLPYNSPYDDYMLAIDELNGVGWWATDRSRVPGYVTIYTFIVPDKRVNVDVDDPNLAARARLASIADTWHDGADYTAVKAKIATIKATDNRAADEFLFVLPDGTALTKLSQVSDTRQRQALERYVAAKKRFDDNAAMLDALRLEYASGNKSASTKILDMERRVDSDREALMRLSNEVVKAARQ